jgi:hypothetical protein
MAGTAGTREGAMRTRSPGTQGHVLFGTQEIQKDTPVPAVSGLSGGVQGQTLGRRQPTATRSGSKEIKASIRGQWSIAHL